MSPPPAHSALTADEAARCGMGLAVAAREHGDRLAITSQAGDRSFAELNARANQLVGALRRRGLRAGDAVALVCSNRPEFAEVYYACQRAGWRLTPINWHLTRSEIAYIVDNCGARVLLADGRFARTVAEAARESGVGVRMAIDGEIATFEDYDDALAAESEDDIADPSLGSEMLYTSGTTGLPKGVHRSAHAQARARLRAGSALAGILDPKPGRDAHLCTGPLHHAAPLLFSLALPLASGSGVVLMDGWSPERTLELIQGYRITHTHMVPIMFNRLMALPDDVRAGFDVSSLRLVLHGAAPCSVELKRRVIDWLGPIVCEYYAATEGWGCLATAEQWLERPGTVGRPTPGEIEIRDDQGKPQAPDGVGNIHLQNPPDAGFEYYGDPEKTRRTVVGSFFTLGDVGYLDRDGFLFLCDRSSDVINSGGVNIYPAEVDSVLQTHPDVADTATIGVPNDEWGEEVLSVVELREGSVPSEPLAEALLDFLRERLARYKCPRRIEFADELPRHENGKIYRRRVRDRYWQDRERRI